MKKFLALVLCLVGLSVICAELDFPGWDCKDVKALDNCIATSTKKYDVIACKVIKSNITDKKSVDSLDKLKKIAGGFVLNVIRDYDGLNTEKLMTEVNKDPELVKSLKYKLTIVLFPSKNIKKYITFTTAEKVLVCEELLLDNSNTVVLNKYLELCVDRPDAEVVKFLTKLYRKNLPKLADDQNIKPFIIKLSLALKSYGVKVD